MPSEDTKTLEFNQYQKSDKATFIIYADHDFLTEKTDGCKNNPGNSYTTKVSEHIPSVFQCLQYHHSKELKINMIKHQRKILYGKVL